jgi:hypothetical protein
MNRDGMADFLERLGHRVVRDTRAYWYDQRGRFMASIPHSVPLVPDRDEQRRIMRASGALGIRHLAPISGPGRMSYAFMVDDPAYDLTMLSANTRSKVRRGLKQCEVGRMDPKEARAEGREANDDTIRRLRFTRDVYDWTTYWDAVESSPGAEVWGARIGGTLVAYAVILHVERCAEILVARSHSEHLKHYPNNALIFTAVQDLIRRDDVDRILFGFESVDTATGVDNFKDSMAFRRWPVRQYIALHPVAERALGFGIVRKTLHRVVDRRRDSEFWRKVEGVLIFHGSFAERNETEKEPAWTS